MGSEAPSISFAPTPSPSQAFSQSLTATSVTSEEAGASRLITLLLIHLVVFLLLLLARGA